MNWKTLITLAVAGAFAAPAAAQSGKGKPSFSGVDRNNNGTLSREEWNAHFKGDKQADAKADKQAKRDGKAPQGAPLIVLLPVTQANSDKLGNGCWARLYDGNNFEGNQLSLVGPVDMPTMRTAFGTDWGGEFDSIMVGPRATVTVYDNENFREKAATFKPNQKVPELSEKMGFFEDVRSLRIACSGESKSAQQGGGASSGATAKQK